MKVIRNDASNMKNPASLEWAVDQVMIGEKLAYNKSAPLISRLIEKLHDRGLLSDDDVLDVLGGKFDKAD